VVPALFQGDQPRRLERVRVEEWNGKRQHAMLQLLRPHPRSKDRHAAIITHRFRLDEYKEAFRYNHEQGRHEAVKVLFDFR